MNKKFASKSTLGPVSARFISQMVESGKEIFTLADACNTYKRDNPKTRQFLRDLVNRGILARIKPGIFIILKTGLENTQLSNWPILARVLAGNNKYYISHYSAMRLHGMTTHPITRVTITTSRKSPPRKLYNITYQFVYSQNANIWGLTEHWVNKQEKVWVSDLERTILDGFEKPKLCGGIKEVIRGIWSKQSQINWNKLQQYAIKYRTKSAVKRLAFIIELFNLDGDCLPRIANSIKTKKDYILLDPMGPKSGEYLSRWRVRINMNLEEIKAGVWS